MDKRTIADKSVWLEVLNTLESELSEWFRTSRQSLETEQEPPVCQVHQVPMALVQGRKGEFWSCHTKNEDGSWCSYRPTEG
jgi:hypothetical protein